MQPAPALAQEPSAVTVPVPGPQPLRLPFPRKDTPPNVFREGEVEFGVIANRHTQHPAADERLSHLICLHGRDSCRQF